MRSRSLSVSLPHHSFALPRICFHLPSRMSLLIGQSSCQIIELVTSQWTGACSYAARVTLTRCASDHRPSSGVRFSCRFLRGCRHVFLAIPLRTFRTWCLSTSQFYGGVSALHLPWRERDCA